VRHEYSDPKRLRQEALQLKRGVDSLNEDWTRAVDLPRYSLDAACAKLAVLPLLRRSNDMLANGAVMAFLPILRRSNGKNVITTP